ncbi:L-lactate dehydrogenase [Clostridium saccharobutylicum]|uniref:L-lactate dehydrogenase n=1 Tax=Clostridium saccharobutylicum DSM 13864 TaxID=1345695 RepID=U5MU62_CLOSA|nr:L-lactate dehydrogenase [Clostridium saccharobutylicum]AGX44130.1 L-lactate dehydrogenase 3 [Clostridium saccharobutylicum DSM 13864]AQR91419.1 L-lactate dehydrogenase 1 [Clostridium saccharobutylicum]AQS01323.1 L-lactate dehydrogenase 1 [Clostridium saccharobutylicum]AQS10933.1 L-lactate dehydrogenase 1 [Clostridium saccharobutylicum]AQS15306.1 L-lactate dehydrogenase 1 [Clostridium saccharobutylicum]
MAIGRSKVVVVGTGAVGAAVAFDIVMNHVCDDLVLIDINKEKSWAEATDLQHSLGYNGNKMKVKDGEYDDCKDADLVVIAAALPYITGQTRLDMMEKAAGIMESIVPPIMKSGFSGIIVVITNPVDVMSYYVHKLSGLPANKVIGTGTALDSARLKYHLADVMNVDPQSVHALCMGEHGDSQVIPWSQITVGGKKFLDIINDNKVRLGEFNIDSVSEDIKMIAYRIVNAKGATTFGIAATTVQIIKAVLRDENKVIPVSAMLNGEYGEKDIYAGVPAVLNNQGIKELVEYHLSENEMAELKKSIAIIRDYSKKLNL